MDTNSFTVGRFKAQANKFSGIISKSLGKVRQRTVRELIFGIQAAKDVKISNVARCLNESIDLIKTEERLCRNLAAEDFSEVINNEIIRLADDKITSEMVISIDPGDVVKPYAQAMEHLCGVWDGSQSTSAQGYHLCQVTGANLQHNKVVPLYCEAFSSKEEGYITLNDKIKKAIDLVVARTSTNGVWAIDRQGDCKEIIGHFLQHQLRFVTRLKLNRWLQTKNKNGGNICVQAERLHRHMTLPFVARITKIEDGIEKVITLRYGVTAVALQDLPGHTFTALVVEGFGERPMILLSAEPLPQKGDPRAAYRILEIYLTRWKCDECFRYIKQAYNLEDLRVRSYNAIRNLVAIVHAIAYFTSVYMGMNLKLRVMVQKVFILSKRFFGIPSFFQYAMADGIYELLKRNCAPLTNENDIKKQPSVVLSLFPD